MSKNVLSILYCTHHNFHAKNKICSHSCTARFSIRAIFRNGQKREKNLKRFTFISFFSFCFLFTIISTFIFSTFPLSFFHILFYFSCFLFCVSSSFHSSPTSHNPLPPTPCPPHPPSQRDACMFYCHPLIILVLLSAFLSI